MGLKIKAKSLIAAGICLSVIFPFAHASAEYRSGSELSGISSLDYIENLRRIRREKKLTPEQEEVKKDAAEMKSHLRQPIDNTKNVPVSIEGDDLMYDQTTGDVYAKGDVVITSIDAQRFSSDEVTGNLKKTEIKSDGLSHMISSKPGEMGYLDGYHLVYNYGKETGKLEDGKGKVGNYYVKGKKIEIYPERIVIYDGWQTKCGAHVPDYRVSGDVIVIYPENEMIIYQAKFWLKDTIYYARDEYHVDIRPGQDNNIHLPKAGYDSDDGIWLKDRYAYDVTRNVEAYVDLAYYTKLGMRNIYGIGWGNGGNHISVEAGRYKDSDDRWIKKKPNFVYSYTNQVGHWPFSYTLQFERGKWRKGDIQSIHTGYSVSLSRHTITFADTWHLNASVGYTINREGYDHSKSKGYSWSTSLIHEMGPYLTGYLGYSYSAVNVKSSLFDYDLQSYARQLNGGLSLQFTDKDRIVCGFERDMQAKSTEDIDWYWFHDMHCAEMILRYRARRDQWTATLQFTPW